MPNPMPMSGNCDVVRIWNGHDNNTVSNNDAQKNVETNNISSTQYEMNNIPPKEEPINNTINQETVNTGIPELTPNISTNGVVENHEVESLIGSPVNQIKDISNEQAPQQPFNIGTENISTDNKFLLNNNDTLPKEDNISQTEPIKPIPEINNIGETL